MASLRECFHQSLGEGSRFLPRPALDSGLTVIKHTDPTTPDYDLESVTNSSAYGFTSADQLHTLLMVVANLQKRVNQLEALAQEFGMVR